MGKVRYPKHHHQEVPNIASMSRWLHCTEQARRKSTYVTSELKARIWRDQRMTISVGRLGVEPPSDTTQLLTTCPDTAHRYTCDVMVKCEKSK